MHFSELQDILGNRLYPAVTQQTNTLRSVDQTLKQSLMGNSSTGASNNLISEQKFRNWTPSSADLMNMVQQGLQTGSLADQIAYYNQKFKIPTVTNPGNPLEDYAVFSAVTTNAALSVADKGFDNVAQIMEQINYLYRLIDQQRTLKQSQELTSVILLKIAALQADLIRLQSQQLKMQAVAHAEGNSRREYMTQFVQDMKNE